MSTRKRRGRHAAEDDRRPGGQNRFMQLLMTIQIALTIARLIAEA